MSISEDTTSSLPDTLGAFIDAHQERFLLEEVRREEYVVRPEESDDLPIGEELRSLFKSHLCAHTVVGMVTVFVRLSYSGGSVIEREVEILPDFGSLSSRPLRPTLWSVLPGLLQSVRELTFITHTRQEWEEVFGFGDREECALRYARRQRDLQDAKTLLGADYAAFAQMADYDADCLDRSGLTSLVLPNLVSAADEDVAVVYWLKRTGEACARDEALVSVEATQRRVELNAPVDGWLRKIVVAPGVRVSSGARLAFIARANEVEGDAL